MIEYLMGDERIRIDARGQIAPLPLLGLKRAIDTASPGQEVELISDDPSLAGDLERFLAASGYELAGTESEGQVTLYLIRQGHKA